VSHKRHGRFFVAQIQIMERGRLMPNVNMENVFTKKIGDAKYQVQIIFSQKSTERFNDKILRLIKNDIAKNRKIQTQKIKTNSQTV